MLTSRVVKSERTGETLLRQRLEFSITLNGSSLDRIMRRRLLFHLGSSRLDGLLGEKLEHASVL